MRAGIRRDMHQMLLSLWRETRMTVFMVTHDIAEAFKLATRVLVLDKVRHDPQHPEAYGATITYDLPLPRNHNKQAALTAAPEEMPERRLS